MGHGYASVNKENQSIMKKTITFALIILIMLSAVPICLSVFEVSEGINIIAKQISEEQLMLGRDDPEAEYQYLMPGELVNINTDSVEQLRKLPAIGEELAKRIVEYRETCGPFAAVEDIMNVAGIGKGRFEELKDHIVVGNPGDSLVENEKAQTT